jgi:DNA-binding transcriptional LysR family regulator
LEREQGVRLFDRVGRGVRLTDAGEMLLPYAQRLLNLEREAGEALALVKGMGAGHLRVGASPTPATYLLPGLLGRYYRDYPAVEISLTVDVTARIAEQVIAGAVGAALVEGEVDDEHLRVEPCYEDELLVVTPPGLRPKDGTGFTPDEVVALRHIAREPSSLTRRVIETTFAAAGLAYEPVMELGNIEVIKKAVEAGLGVSVLSECAVVDEVKMGRLGAWCVYGMPVRRTFSLLTHVDAVVSPSVAAFLKLVEGQRRTGRALH